MESWWPLITALFQVVQAAGLVVGGLYTALKIQRTASAGATLMSATISGLQDDVKTMQSEISRLTDVVIVQTRQTEQLNAFRERMDRHERWWDELRRGEGFMLPLNKGAHDR